MKMKTLKRKRGVAIRIQSLWLQVGVGMIRQSRHQRGDTILPSERLAMTRQTYPPQEGDDTTHQIYPLLEREDMIPQTSPLLGEVATTHQTYPLLGGDVTTHQICLLQGNTQGNQESLKVKVSNFLRR